MALTDNQNKIIDEIKNQFENINSVDGKPIFNILDITELKQEVNRIETGKKELNIIAERYDAIRKELVINTVNQLNEDFKTGDLPLEAENYYGYKFFIQCNNAYPSVNSHYKITINVEFDNIDTEFGSKCIGLLFKSGNDEKIKYSNINDLLKDERVKKQLIKLLEETNKAILKC